jgi:hypothetical protein
MAPKLAETTHRAALCTVPDTALSACTASWRRAAAEAAAARALAASSAASSASSACSAEKEAEEEGRQPGAAESRRGLELPEEEEAEEEEPRHW